jgi:hypothetical protein
MDRRAKKTPRIVQDREGKIRESITKNGYKNKREEERKGRIP